MEESEEPPPSVNGYRFLVEGTKIPRQTVEKLYVARVDSIDDHYLWNPELEEEIDESILEEIARISTLHKDPEKEIFIPTPKDIIYQAKMKYPYEWHAARILLDQGIYRFNGNYQATTALYRIKDKK